MDFTVVLKGKELIIHMGLYERYRSLFVDHTVHVTQSTN